MPAHGGNTVVNIYVDSRTLLRMMSNESDESMLEILKEALELYRDWQIAKDNISSSDLLEKLCRHYAEEMSFRLRDEIGPKMFEIFQAELEEVKNYKPWLKNPDAAVALDPIPEELREDEDENEDEDDK